MRLAEAKGIREFLDALPYYALIIDSGHRLLMANDIAQKDLITGNYPDVLKKCFEHIEVAGLPHPDCPLNEAVETNQEVHQTIREPDGSWLRLSIYPIDLTSDSGDRLYFHTIRDSTQMIKEGLELGFRGELLDEVSDSIFVHDSQGHVLYANRAAYEDRGYTQAEMLRISLVDMDVAAQAPMIQQRMDAVQQNKLDMFETEHRRKDGSIFSVEIKSRSIKYYDQNCFIATCRDITERKKKEAEINRRGDLLDSVTDSVFVVDTHGNIKYANRACYESRGYSPDEILKMQVTDMTALGSEELAKQQVGEIMRNGQADFENVHRRKDGSVFPVEISGRRVKFGDVDGIIGVVRDITERREEEVEIKKRGDLLDSVTDSVFVIDTNGKIRFANRSAYESRGYSAGEVLKLAVTDLVAPGHQEFAKQAVGEIFRKGQAHFDNFHKRKDGAIFPVEVDGRKVKFGDVDGIIGVVRDITERKKTEERLHAYMLQQAEIVRLEKIALSGKPAATVMDESVKALVKGLDVEYAKVLELLPDGQALVLRSGVGWKKGLVGKATVSSGKESQAGYTLLSDKPVIVKDLNREKRFHGPPLLFDHGVVSGMSIIIAGPDRPFGVLGVHTVRKRAFTKDELKFLQAIANLISTTLQRNNIEDTLRRNERRLLEAQQIAHLGNWEWDVRTDTWNLSEEALRIFGYSVNDSLSGLDVHPADKEVFQQNLDTIMKNGTLIDAVYRVLLTDGSIRYVNVQAEALLDDSGVRTRAIGTVQDITDRKDAEEQIRAQRDTAQMYQDIVGVIMVALNPKMEVVMINRYGAELLGYPESEIIGKNWIANFIPERLRPKINEVFEAAISEKMGEYGVFENPVLTKDGQERLISWRNTDYIGPDGKTMLTMSAGQDVTEIELAREAVDQSCRRLSKVVDGVIHALAETIETKDPYTAVHQVRVAALASAVAQEMGLPEDKIKHINMAATVHDIGKIYIPAEILNKPGNLTDLEFAMIKTHAAAGYNILKDIEFDTPIALDVLQHHERLDGSGYPNGDDEGTISQNARIIAVADVVEAMSSNRPYRPGLGLGPALDELKDNRGRLYDRDAVDACVALFESKRFSF